MSNVAITRTRFLDSLNQITEGRDKHDKLTTNLRAALLAFASETPDNLNCAQQIEVGAVGEDVGIKVRGQALLFSDIAHAIEDDPIPKALKNAFPDVTENEWDAFARLTTLIYSLLEQNSSSDR